MAEKTCPDLDELRQFALGQSAPARFDAVASHVEACAGCHDRLAQLDASTDELLDRLPRVRAARQSRGDNGENWSNAILACEDLRQWGATRIAADVPDRMPGYGLITLQGEPPGTAAQAFMEVIRNLAGQATAIA